MIKRFLLVLAILVCIFPFISKENEQSIDYKPVAKNIIPMPLVIDDPLAVRRNAAPIAKRGVGYRKWLSKGVLVLSRGGAGSGTIIYYDRDSGWAYIQSCGHLWNGYMSSERAKQRNVKCSIVTWYHNDIKLDEPRKYDAEVLFYSNHHRPDISLIRFKPDWVPQFFPIAPYDYKITPGMKANSIGCDGAREVAHYDVNIVGYRDGPWLDLVTVNNSPRSGRSGGGLISNDGYYIGICWGTSDSSGRGNGYFTPLSDIYAVMEKEGYGWLLRVSTSLARELPVVDRNNPQGEYPLEYIAIPRFNF